MGEELIFTAVVISSNDYRFLIKGLNILDATDNLITYLQVNNKHIGGTPITSIRINPVEFSNSRVIQV